MEHATILQFDALTKRFKSGRDEITVLHNICFTLKEGETCAVVGPSGSGKTTLLTLAAGLDRPSSGKVSLQGQDLGVLDEDSLAKIRRTTLGFVFQNFQLLPSLTALENVLLPLELQGKSSEEEAKALLSSVGLAERFHHYPSQLSGGEQQRVALARAFINRPLMLCADEPTGSLDQESAERALQAMFDLKKDHRVSILLVTHDLDLARRMDRRLTLRKGNVVSDA